jgi:hypothetical protein
MLEERYGGTAPYQAGLNVYTTVDLPTQRAAEQALRSNIDAIDMGRTRARPLRRLTTTEAARFLAAAKAARDPNEPEPGRSYQALVLAIEKSGVRVQVNRFTGLLVATKDHPLPAGLGKNDVIALKLAQSVAAPLRIPIMIHMGQTESSLPDILANRGDVLTPRMAHMIEDLAQDYRRLDTRIDNVTEEIEALVKRDEACERLMTVPGIGPIISSATVATIGDGSAFRRGRDFGAWLGLVPRQISTGDRTILGRISKRGNRYLRMLFVQAARVILLRPANWHKYSFGRWLEAAAKRMHHNVLAAALANKLSRG